MAGSKCTFALKIAGTSDFLAVLQSFAALYVIFSGMSLKKSQCAFLLSVGFNKSVFPIATSCNSFHRTKTLGL
jgi:hypothetical protein